MRLLTRLLIILAICFSAVALPSSPAQAEGADIILSPNDGVPGKEIKIYGYNFTEGTWVEIYYDMDGDDELEDDEHQIDKKTDDDGDFYVDFKVPESCTGGHKVWARDTSGAQASDYFNVEPGLTIETTEGTVGTTVTVEGHGFTEKEKTIELRYYLNDVDYEIIQYGITANKDGWWEESFRVPSSARGDHIIDAWGEKNELDDVHEATFEVMPEISVIDAESGSVKDPSGSAGESIAIKGTGFKSGDSYIHVFFAGEEVETEILRAGEEETDILRAGENGNWTARFTVPEMPRGTYSITAEGELTKDINELSFKIGPGLVLSPDKGHVGMNVTVTGGGFAPDEDVVIKYDAKDFEPPATTTTNEVGGFEVSFLVPKSKYGIHNVTAEFDGETEAARNFTMESDAPGVPELISPPDGDRLGFIGNVRVTLNWSDVEDLSGVRYNLQIATSANFTATGGFADPIRTISSIVGSNYTLDKTEALPFGTYYWIVQAVDGAENTGNWTEPYSFSVGVMPLWAFVVIIVVVAGGIGAAVYFLVIRKRVYYY